MIRSEYRLREISFNPKTAETQKTFRFCSLEGCSLLIQLTPVRFPAPSSLVTLHFKDDVNNGTEHLRSPSAREGKLARELNYLLSKA